MQPKKHHYIPAFYLKRWAGPDGHLVEFSRPFREVVPQRKHPNATGFADRLYELRGFPPALAQQVEEKFFKAVDGSASAALALMEQQGNGATWTSDLRSAWSRFLLSLLTRCPEDLQAFRATWMSKANTASDEAEQRYAAIRSSDDPPTFAEFIAQEPQQMKEKALFEAYMKLVDNRSVGERLNPLLWHVIETPLDGHALLTSDRPIVRTNGLLVPDGHLVMPIGPRRLFVAAPAPETVERIAQSDLRKLVKAVNARVVGAAVRYVYGSTDAQLRFVANRMSTEIEPRLMSFSAGAFKAKP